MSMHYTIELYFDKKTEAAINSLYKKLKTRNAVSPHISLCGFETKDPDKLIRTLKRFAIGIKGFPLSFENVGIFPGVIFLGPAVTADLLKIHHGCMKRIRPFVKNVNPYFEVNRLVFHCTLGLGLSKASLQKAVGRLLKLPWPRHVVVNRMLLRRYEGDGPSETLLEVPLGMSAGKVKYDFSKGSKNPYAKRLKL